MNAQILQAPQLASALPKPGPRPGAAAEATPAGKDAKQAEQEGTEIVKGLRF